MPEVAHRVQKRRHFPRLTPALMRCLSTTKNPNGAVRRAISRVSP